MKRIFTSIFFLACFFLANAQQVINLGSSSPASVTGCSFTIYDFGGLNGDYAPNHDDMITIYSGDPNNHSVLVNVDILSFDVDCSDTLFIYNGSTPSPENLLVALTNCITDSINSTVLTYAATITNPDGCLTIRFKSDGSGEGAGFVLTTDCTWPCQRVEVAFDEVLSTKVPHLEDDGYWYIDVCPDEELHLVAKGVYPDNNYSYNQNDASSKFHWDLGWEIQEDVGLSELVYTFPEGRGYDVSVSITDSVGCFSYIPQIFRVRTSSNPIRQVFDLPDICMGSEVTVGVGYDFVSTLQVDTVGSEQITSLSVSDTIFLPDGVPCGTPASCSYISPVTFTSFSPAATIQSANDILFVRISLEHSYIGDIWIKLTCPNQQYVSIMKKYDAGSSSCSSQIPYTEKGWNGYGSPSSYFGVPVDDSGNGCTPTPMGTCWNYCWSNNTEQGYQYAPGTAYVYNTTSITNNRVDSTNVAQMTNVYHPDGSFANLIGCPLNGTWSIEVMDGYSVDNGYICGWEIALDPSLLPQDWSYNVLIDSAWIEGPGAGNGGVTFVPDSAGFITYNVFVMDELGCVYDTITKMKVTTNPTPELGEDFNICYGDIVTVQTHCATDTAAGETTTYYWNTGDETASIEVITEGDYYVKCQTTSVGGLTCVGYDTIHVGIFESPHFDFDAPEMSGCAPLNLHIENNSTPEDADFEWYIVYFDDAGDQQIAYSSTLRSPSFKLENPGSYSIILKATTQDGCKDSVTLWNYIIVNDVPQAAFDADPEVSLLSESQGVVTFTNYANISAAGGEACTYYWDFGDNNSDSTFSPAPHVYNSWGDYIVTLHIESNSGCSSEISHIVVIEQDLVFPNVITPNGDNINDVFAIENLNTNINYEDPDGYRNNRLIIHDRWGKKVYDAKNYDTYSKDGMIYVGEKAFDGSGLSDGIYYYTFEYKGKAKTITFNGSLTIVR